MSQRAKRFSSGDTLFMAVVTINQLAHLLHRLNDFAKMQ